MIRAPVVNTVLNTARTLRQLVRGENGFEAAVLRGTPSAGAVVQAQQLNPARVLELRDLTSRSLWLTACIRARRSLNRAIANADATAVESNLTTFGALLKLGGCTSALGTFSPSLLFAPLYNLAEKWYLAALKEAIGKGLVVPGKTRSVPSSHILLVHSDPSTTDLLEREALERSQYEQCVQKGLSGRGHVYLEDRDLTGLDEKMRDIWASRLGNLAVWRKAKYKVPVGHDSINRIMPFCQNHATRKKLFEAYFANFDNEVHGAALKLLRTRKELAQKLGFRSWAAFQLRELSIGSPEAAHRLMDQMWQEMQGGMSACKRRMQTLEAAARQGGSARGGATTGAASQIAHVDEAFFRALLRKEKDIWRLAEFLPAAESLPRILEIVGKAYGVEFREVDRPSSNRYHTGWHKSVRIFEVRDGPRVGFRAAANRGSLGFVYLDLYVRQSLLGRSAVALGGAQMMCKGHTYVCLNMPPASFGSNKLLNAEEVVMMAHELGHAVHMLCHNGTCQELEELPLDVIELPSTLVETIALHPGVVSQYARHHSSGGPPPEGLVRACQRDVQWFARYLQTAHVALGLHGDGFDPHEATADDLRAAAVGFWQKYSMVPAHPGFSPLGEDAGPFVGQGSNHVAYILCYLRVEAILYAAQAARTGPAGSISGPSKIRAKDATQRWLSTDFSSRIRAQLLDRGFPAERRAALLPTLVADGADAPPHPLPSPPLNASALIGRASQWAAT